MFYVLYKGIEGTGTQVGEAMAGFAMEPMPMFSPPGSIVSLGTMFPAVEDKGLGEAIFFKIVEGSVDRCLVAEGA